MKNKKIITLIATLGLITCLHTKVDAVKFYDTLGTRYEGAVERLAELEIIDGISENTFKANRNITRAEFAKLIVEATLNEDEIGALSIDHNQLKFTDISKDAWYYKYVLVATNYGYINGYNDNTFKPNKEVTYEEVAKMLMKALGHGYLVETDPRGWSAEYMDKLYSLNIADGTANFEKKDNATRGNVAILLWNTLTNNVWEKIWLNDVTGFTYVDSGKTLFDKKISGYVFKKNLEIKGFREVNGKLCVQTSNVAYNQLFDQNMTVNFSMIGGKTDVLYKIVRYAQNEIKYEIVGLSPDIGSQLYTGTIDELKEDGLSLRVDTQKFSRDANYGFYIKADSEENNRLLSINTKNKRFYIDKIEIKDEKVEIKEDEDFVIEDENDIDYLYVGNYEKITRTITLNEEYEIQDGAVLFENNKRVNWNSVQAGDVITEIEKDKYYFVSREVIDVTIKDYEKTINEILFETSEGKYTALKNTECVEYYTKNNKINSLFNFTTSKLDLLKNIKVKFHLDFAENIARLEILEDYTKTETVDSLQKLEVGYYYSLDYGTKENNNVVTMIYDGKKKTYRTAIKSVNVNLGDLVYYTLDEANVIKEIKPVANGVKLNEKLKINNISYEDLSERVQKDLLSEIPVYHSKYYYDFGEYDKVIDFEVKKTSIDNLENFDKDKYEYYIITDNDDFINIILVMDYSEKKDVFYGKINNIYLADNNEIKAEIDIFNYKKASYKISGLLNSDEGNVVAFKILDKDTIKILEKFTDKSLGYYKDIIIKDINWNDEVTAENGVVNLKTKKILIDAKEYKFSEFDILLITVSKDKNGIWQINKGEILNEKELDLKDNDRIAVNEIEGTIIIYRGYKE